jgi:hypothetical protein
MELEGHSRWRGELQAFTQCITTLLNSNTSDCDVKLKPTRGVYSTRGPWSDGTLEESGPPRDGTVRYGYQYPDD